MKIQRVAQMAASWCALGWLAALPAKAQSPTPPQASIDLPQLLANVSRYHPKLASAKAKGLAATEYFRAARGAYDPKLSADLDARLVGQYQFGVAGVKVSQLTPFWGLSGFAGYQLGWGDLPVYRGEQKTGNLGKLKAGLALPVLAGGAIDQARATRSTARLGVSAQDCEIDQVRLDLLRDAANAYWDWVARALEVRIKQELLGVAQARNKALQERLQSGAIAAIVLLDNQRLVIGRESKLIEAQRKLSQGSVKMSLYWRDAQGHPQRALASQIPAALGPSGDSHLEALPSAQHSATEIDEALARMPSICKLSAQIAKSQVEVSLARNQRLPQLDLQGYVAQYLGDKVPVLPTDLGIGLKFSLALGMRKVTGKWRAAQASLTALTQERRRIQDQTVAELAKARIDVRAAHRQLQIADRKVQLSREMASAERSKFEQGASDLILVNLREQALADAQRDRVVAWAALQKARIQNNRARGLDPLGRVP